MTKNKFLFKSIVPLLLAICVIFFAILGLTSLVLLEDFKTSVFGSFQLFFGISLISFALILFFYSFAMHKNHYRFENYSFLTNITQITTGIFISLILFSFIYPKLPSMIDLKYSADKELEDTFSDIRHDIDYLIDSSQYDLLEEETMHSILNKENMVFNFKKSEGLKRNQEFIDENKSPIDMEGLFKNSPVQDLIKAKPQSFGRKEAIPENQNLPFAKQDIEKILVYGKFSEKTLLDEKGEMPKAISLSAEINGAKAGECFFAFQQQDYTEVRSFLPPDKKEVTTTFEMKSNIHSKKFCIEENSKQIFNQKISYKANLDLRVYALHFWIVAEDGSDITVNTNIEKDRYLSFTNIETKKIGKGFLWDNSETYCIEGFHKGNPDKTMHKINSNNNFSYKHSESEVSEGKCPANYK